MQGTNPDIISETDLELHELLPAEKRARQLGANKHPAFTYRAMDMLQEPTKTVWGRERINFLSGNYMAHPSEVFRAMAGEGDYPVKAFFMMANNPLMSYPNMQMVHKGLMNQDLIVAFEQFRSPSAQLADYILPSDAWLERPALLDGYGWHSIYRTGQKIVDAPGECRSAYDFWKGLADRMGFAEHFPWSSLEELYTHRISKIADDFTTFAESNMYHFAEFAFKKYEQTGFATPSGKVELKSSILEELGFDALPYWREDPDVGDRFPLKMFIGIREDEYFQTGHRHIAKLRKRNQAPRFFVSPKDASENGLTQGGWASVSTVLGSVKAQVEILDDMPEGVVRVPHGWWQPERPEGDGTLSGAWEYSDSQICPDDDDNVDWEQGVPQLKGLACRIDPVDEDRSFDWTEQQKRLVAAE